MVYSWLVIKDNKRQHSIPFLGLLFDSCLSLEYKVFIYKPGYNKQSIIYNALTKSVIHIFEITHTIFKSQLSRVGELMKWKLAMLSG